MIGQAAPGVPALKPKPPNGFIPAAERKEALSIKEAVAPRETAPVVEVGPPKEVGPEVKDWMERLETGEEIQLPQPVTDDAGQVILDTSAPRQVEVKLPLTEAEIQRGLHQEIVNSIRWLAEWCRRLLKMAGTKFIYRIKKGSER